MKLIPLLLFPVLLITCTQKAEFDQETIDKVIKNAEQANEAYVRSMAFTKAWLTKVDTESGLIPTNLSRSIDEWQPHNSAADNYPFMVLTAYLLDRDMYNGVLLDMLNTERKLTSRVRSLPDSYSFSRKDFVREDVDMGKVIFGSSEYIKDGLIPLNEYIGVSPWQDRMMEMLDDLHEYMREAGDLEKYFTRTATIEEVNGEMLQTLSRIYWMTGDQKYLDWAIQIGDYYLLGQRDLSQIEYLRIRDHGCEIIGGLSELYVTLHYVDPVKKKAYSSNLYRLLDRVLEVGRNEDGLFYNAVNAKTGEVVDKNTVDNWGYVFDAYYSVWLVDNKKEYREAVLSGFTQLNNKYRNFRWEGDSHDGYADALESGINLYNREPVAGLKSWIDNEMQVMFGMQQDDGILGGWHGDGNFARTAIMYALWKTAGAHVYPWREDIKIGAEEHEEKLYIVISAENDWSGKLTFDAARHKTILNLPIDYPRINQFPEWFVAKEGETYTIRSDRKDLEGTYSARELLNGISMELKKDEKIILTIF